LQNSGGNWLLLLHFCCSSTYYFLQIETTTDHDEIFSLTLDFGNLGLQICRLGEIPSLSQKSGTAAVAASTSN
jgi:hypothetical protein